MTTKSLKANINAQIKKIDDDRFLRIVYSMLQEFIREEEEIAGYEPGGKPITKQMLVERIKKSEEDIKKGNVYTHEEVVKMFAKRIKKNK
jgi:hypothetical protein